MKKTPSRMGNSEARLHKRRVGKNKAKVERAAAAIETRIEQLEVKERPSRSPQVRMDIRSYQQLHGKVAIQGDNICKSFGNKVLLDESSFQVYTGTKVALIGDNGSGKTTLLKMILAREKGIHIARGARIGYFSQDLKELDPEKTVLEEVSQNSSYPLSDVRLLLARLLFRREDVYKKIRVLTRRDQGKKSKNLLMLNLSPLIQNIFY